MRFVAGKPASLLDQLGNLLEELVLLVAAGLVAISCEISQISPLLVPASSKAMTTSSGNDLAKSWRWSIRGTSKVPVIGFVVVAPVDTTR